MLILSRLPNESIMIGDDITFTVLEVNKNRVKIGIDASKDVLIHRFEVWLKIKEQERLAESVPRGTD